MTFEECAVLADHLQQILSQTVLEVEFLQWLAMNRRAKLTEAVAVSPQHEIVAKILEEAAEKCNAVMLNARAYISPDHLKFIEQMQDEITDDHATAILDRELPLLLKDGFKESEIVRFSAAWRTTALNDKRRSEEKKPLDEKLAEILHATASRLEMALTATVAGTDGDQPEISANVRKYVEEAVQSGLPPATKILRRNPSLLRPSVDFTELVKCLNRTGRNEPCPCKSGKKFKKCCGS